MRDGIMSSEKIITNANVVLRDEVIFGTVRIVDGFIHSVDEGAVHSPNAEDLESDYLIPGLIELHTDNLEKHLQPRPKVIWPSPLAALLSHDTQICGAGITTVLDSVFLGATGKNIMRPMIIDDSIESLRLAVKTKICKSEHFLHLRCEVTEATLLELFERFRFEPFLKLVSLNDHTPGQRQWREMRSYRAYNKMDAMSEDEIDRIVSQRKEMQEKYGPANRRYIAEACRDSNMPLASHDDTTEEHILEALEEGAAISEFPTTLEASSKARECGVKIIAGAPNMVRGGSHSGNISVNELAERKLLDSLSSDYVPASLLHAAFLLYQEHNYSLPEAVAAVTANPAEMVNLFDRGSIEPGKRADLVRVKVFSDLPVVRTVWREGRRVC